MRGKKRSLALLSKRRSRFSTHAYCPAWFSSAHLSSLARIASESMSQP